MSVKGKTIFRGGMISEGIVSGKSGIELITGTSNVTVGRNYLSDTTFNISLQSGNEIAFKIDNSAELIGNKYTFYVSDSPGTLTGASIIFTPTSTSRFFGLASCSDENLEIRGKSEVVINEARYLKGCLINIRLISSGQISINITSPDESSKISIS